MPLPLVVPSMGESITEVEIGVWRKQVGDQVQRDEPLVAIESDKATVELPAPSSGTLLEIVRPQGSKANVGDLIGYFEPIEAAITTAAPVGARATTVPSAAAHPSFVMPAARRALEQAELLPDQVQATGPSGRILKEDVVRVQRGAGPVPSGAGAASQPPPTSLREEIVPMSAIRRRIAERLVHAKQSMAMLTTFNEIDMSELQALRKSLQEEFQKRHGVKLGMMSFFVKAALDALRQFPQVNAEIRGEEIVYKHYYDIGIAVGGGKGLVVPVLRDANRMSFASIERQIGDFGARAKEGTIKLEELQGGTFTITNGGVYGSLLATPIVNPPQVAILGLHAIQERPVARGGEVVIRPMMYVALSYDHRLIDGRESVSFLKRIKECIEQPARALLEV